MPGGVDSTEGAVALVSFVTLSSRELSRRSHFSHHQTPDIRKVRRTLSLVYTVSPKLSPQCPAKCGKADHGNIFCKTWHLCYKTFQMWVKFKSNRHCQITMSGAAYDMIVLSRGPLLPLHIKLTNVTKNFFYLADCDGDVSDRELIKKKTKYNDTRFNMLHTIKPTCSHAIIIIKMMWSS